VDPPYPRSTKNRYGNVKPQFNSVIYASTRANDYFVFPVNRSQIFVENSDNMYTSGDFSQFNDGEGWIPSHKSSSFVLKQLLESARAGELDWLDNEDCIKSYGKMYLSNRSNLLLVGWDFPTIARYSIHVYPQ
jgi:hypothetical protein